jgi:hypothetical protein
MLSAVTVALRQANPDGVLSSQAVVDDPPAAKSLNSLVGGSRSSFFRLVAKLSGGPAFPREGSKGRFDTPIVQRCLPE